MNSYLKEKWTEDEILALPDGEHNYFDRKETNFLFDIDFPKDLAKALSAFANSGGGHIIVGVRNDGTFEGVDKIYTGKKGKGRQETREWLEQIIPNLLNYPLREYRVHNVNASTIPKDKVLIVIDVGDSKLAPHQTNLENDVKLYYQRIGGHSVPAEHHNISLLFGRSNRFPNTQIVRGWFDLVINPLIEELRNQEKLLDKEIQFIDENNIYGLSMNIYHICDGDTLEQFLDFYSDVQNILNNYLSNLIDLNQKAANINRTLSESEEIIDMIQSSKEAIFSLRMSDVVSEHEEMWEKVPNEKIRDYLVEPIINKTENLPVTKTIGSLWNVNRSEFLTVLDDSSLKEDYQDFLNKLVEFRTCINRMLDNLNSVRKNISIEFGVPIKEKEKQSNVLNIPFPPPIY